MRKGDHLVTKRFGYTHHGIYLGNQEVIHYSGFANGFQSGVIEITSYAEFTDGNPCSVKQHSNRKYGVKMTISRALSRLGEDWYNVLLSNCEHFVSWCIMGMHSSRQVNNLIAAVVQSHTLLTVADTAIAARVLTAVVGTSAASASTATTTAGLITLGGSAFTPSVVGGASLMGIGAIAGAPVIAAAAALGLVGVAVWHFWD